MAYNFRRNDILVEKEKKHEQKTSYGSCGFPQPGGCHRDRSDLAYFTDQTDTQNVINMGHVDIDLVEHEITQDEDGNWVYDETKPVTSEGLIFTDVYPGETVAKDPTVTLAEGSGDAYIRVKMEIDISDSTLTPNDAAALKANIDKEIAKSGKWYEAADGYYYYNTALTEEDSSAVPF